MSSREFTDEQLRAIERRDGELLVRAGAGTGKTSVLVERFVRSVAEDGLDVDAILAITFTEKSAAEMKARIRARFVELGRRDRAREAEGAWISTIHAFCSRLLRTHSLAAGVDPDYRVLDEVEADRLGTDAFDGALEEFLAGDDPQRVEMAAAYTPDRLRDMVRTAFSRLRSRAHVRPALDPAEPPRPAGERERLEAAAAAAAPELAAAGEGVQVRAALGNVERCAAMLERLGPDELLDPAELEDLELKGGAKALSSPTCEEYRDALAAFSGLCIARRRYLDHTMLRELLDLHGERYERLKRERSGLDFEDLELLARDLLARHASLRERYTTRFAHVLVDEFQDTNPLQNELLELVGKGRLFRVGDENQSIYGFRNAEVNVFRSHYAVAREAGRAESVTVNFRSRGEVLDAIDLIFGRVWGEGFEPLRARPGSRDDAPRARPPVELLVVEKGRGRWDELPEDAFGAAMRSATPWRACEARLLAKRIDELMGHGYALGDVVLLLRATTHMALYERALEERGVATHVVGGRGFFGQQQVADLRHWLSALANPRDELAVYSVLASPLVGASIDAVALVATWSRRLRRDPWWVVREAFAGDGSEGFAEALPERDRRAISAFVARFREEREETPRISLETLIDRAVTRTGYDRHVLALPAGPRRMANVRKLMRMAREYEAREGPDLRGFVDALAERELIVDREGEAPLDAEVRAVRLMTIHRAKGLEFPVVCVGDLGKTAREDHSPLRISDDGELGLRLASLAGGSIDTEELERMKADQRIAAEEEEKRVFYVAMTRAQEHLVLSGAVDLAKRPEAKPLCEPMRWIQPALCSELPAEGASGEALEEYDGREVRVRWTRCTPETIDDLLPERDRAPARPAPAAEEPPALAPLELGAVTAPRALPVSRLSYSGLEDHKRCGYRFYAERALRLPRADSLVLGEVPRPVDATTDELDEADELPPLLRGTIVHELLERLDFRRPVVPREDAVAAAIERHGAAVRPEDVADLRRMIEGFAGSALRERIARARRVRTELPFAFTLVPGGGRGDRSLLVNGVVDVHAAEDGGALIVDYKSDLLNGDEPEAVVDEKYATQRLVYALAGLRAGAERVEVVHFFLERPEEPVVALFDAARADELERELLGVARGVVEARFEPTPHPHRELCFGCPAQPALCSWGPERTLAEA